MEKKVDIVKVKCPRCGTRAGWQGNPHRPFCSEKCRTIDLGRWAGEEYRIPGERAPSSEEEEEQ